jgi:hypothetical protein
MAPLLRFALLGTFVLAFAGCESAATGPGAKARAGGEGGGTHVPAWVALERSGNNGLIYRVTLFEGGAVLFEGAGNSRRPGSVSRHIPPESASAIFRQLELVDFWEREPRYDIERTNRGGDSLITRTAPEDAIWDAIVAQRASRTKRIDGLFFAPQELLDLKKSLEQTVGLAAWLSGGGGL